MRTSKLIIITFILLSFILAVYLYPQMPEKMAAHWNIRGEVDGYFSKFWGLFLMPLVSLLIFLFFLLIPKIDPLRDNIEKFRKYFDAFIVLVVVFLFYLYLLTIFWNLGWRFNLGRWMMPALGILFYCVGVLVEHAERNWFIGLRTPWTLSSEKVWKKTHQIGGKLFKVAAVVILAGMIWLNYAFLLTFFSLGGVVAYTILYSYLIYRKEVEK